MCFCYPGEIELYAVWKKCILCVRYAKCKGSSDGQAGCDVRLDKPFQTFDHYGGQGNVAVVIQTGYNRFLFAAGMIVEALKHLGTTDMTEMELFFVVLDTKPQKLVYCHSLWTCKRTFKTFSRISSRHLSTLFC